jgi:hypothetical protein
VIRVGLACGVILLFPRPARAQQDQSDVADRDVVSLAEAIQAVAERW